MTQKHRHKASIAFISACEQLARAFCDTLGISRHSDGCWWVDYGGTFAFQCGEMFAGAEDMMLVIENGMSWEDFVEWYYQFYDFDHETLEQKPNRINLRSWLMGARPEMLNENTD